MVRAYTYIILNIITNRIKTSISPERELHQSVIRLSIQYDINHIFFFTHILPWSSNQIEYSTTQWPRENLISSRCTNIISRHFVTYLFGNNDLENRYPVVRDKSCHAVFRRTVFRSEFIRFFSSVFQTGLDEW